MVKRIVTALLLAVVLIQPGASATVQTSLPVWDSDYLADILAQAELKWGRLREVSGEVAAVGGDKLLLRTPSGDLIGQVVSPGALVYVNRLPSSLRLLSPIQGAPLFARCLVGPGGQAVIVESSFQGIECDLLAQLPGSLSVRCDDGTLHFLRVWPGCAFIQSPSAPFRRAGRCFILLDMENQVRRVWI